MKYSAGQKVRIKSIDWYNENKDENVDFNNPLVLQMTSKMSLFCDDVVTIKEVHYNYYSIYEDNNTFCWTDEMIEGLVEEEKVSNVNSITQDRVDKIACKIDEELPSGNPYEWECPEGYQFVDENGNVINATKIVLEKKHNDKLKLESTKKVREYWSEYARIYIEIYDDEPNECVLTHLYTLEGHRQKGYGRQALIEAESIAKELGCHTTYLKVETDSWMHQWYLRMGYKWYKNVNKEYTWLTKNL